MLVIKKEDIKYNKKKNSFRTEYKDYSPDNLQEELFDTECKIKENDLEISNTSSSIQNRTNIAMIFATIAPALFSYIWFEGSISLIWKWITIGATVVIAGFWILITTFRCKRILFNNIIDAKELKLKREVLLQMSKEKNNR